jgi:hypothetical protein
MIHHILKHAKHAKHLGKMHQYYADNPHKVGEHGRAAVQVGTLAWTHRHTVAKHTTKFLQSAALKGFNLFRS